MTSDQAWELAGLARCDGDSEAENRYTNIARGLPLETIRLCCWMCVGNGITSYPNCDVEVCVFCNGKGYQEHVGNLLDFARQI